MAEHSMVSYRTYLGLPELLDAQQPLAEPPAHDEMIFIIVHQTAELWFKLLLHELTAVRDAMLDGDARRARELLDRCRAIERHVVSQVDLLDTLSPMRFHEFRSALEPASGIQSTQFREIEFLSGWNDERYLRSLPGLSSGERDVLRRRLREPNLWEAFVRLLARAGLAINSPAVRRGTLLTLARGDTPRGELWDVAEGLLDHDQAWSLWRGRHAIMVERQIGSKTGTGGSNGVAYLRARQDEHFYPELWEVRSRL
jgi:tryptophan 2,3-dioxygenase